MASYEYNKKYAEKYIATQDEIKIRVPKGTKDIWKAAAPLVVLFVKTPPEMRTVGMEASPLE